MTNLYQARCLYCNGSGQINITALGVKRRDLGIKQSELALALGLPRTTVANVETGKQAIATKYIKSWANMLEMSADELLSILYGESNNQPNTPKGEGE